MVTKKIHKFILESSQSLSRGESNIIGSGKLEECQGRVLLDLQLEEQNLTIPINYYIYLVVDGDENYNLGIFHSGEEKIINQQFAFFLEEIGLSSDQIKAISIKGVTEEEEEYIFLLTGELGQPDIELIFDENEVNHLLENKESKKKVVWNIPEPLISKEEENKKVKISYK